MGGHEILHERGRPAGRHRWRRSAVAIAAAVGATLAGLGAAAPSASAQTAGEAAQVSLVHAIPGIEIDLFLDGEELAPDFALGEVRDISAFAGQDLAGLTAVRSGTEQPLGPISAGLVPAAGPASVVVHLDETLSILVTSFDDVAPSPAPAPGNGLLTIRHVAAAPSVDVFVRQTGQTVSLAPAGQVDVVIPAGNLGEATLLRNGESLLALPDVSIVEGERTIVYVSGTSGEGSLVTTSDSVPIETADDGPESPVAGGDAGAADQDSAGPLTQQSEDGTPQPTLVDTGALPGPGDSAPLVALGAASLAGALLLFSLRRRLT